MEQQDHDYLMRAEEVVGLDVGGWMEDNIQVAADIKLPKGSRKEDIEPLNGIFERVPGAAAGGAGDSLGTTGQRNYGKL